MPEINLFAPRGQGGRHPSLADRIDAAGDCWLWTGAKDRRGYGQINCWPNGTKAAHRVVYEALVGPVPDGLELDHLCRTPSCVNPDHLEPVTHLENMRRGAIGHHTKGRTHCKRGHPFDEKNTYHTPDGRRQCRTCQRRRVKEAQSGRDS